MSFSAGGDGLRLFREQREIRRCEVFEVFGVTVHLFFVGGLYQLLIDRHVRGYIQIRQNLFGHALEHRGSYLSAFVLADWRIEGNENRNCWIVDGRESDVRRD